ncbi:MAG: 16S rRNA (cytosine(1402)-N(4))-methyltransferase RsmH, partial [Candidatus Gastranaerophilales bacterium]|nr:16S rRNA (cytosine(1402)-N(4))-methyltransferase RsmH [Candidatus Gastranaerophilales bacterium]
SYAELKNILEELEIEKISGIIFDLGASYYQLTAKERGFSFKNDAPLDMRFDKSQKLCAWDVVNEYREEKLVEIFSKYGEERFSKRIARKITTSRPINTTLQLANLISSSTPHVKSSIHPATRVFQAIRIEVNGELLNFENTLNDVLTLLSLGGIISVISFHSLEDRLTKNFFKKYSLPCRCKKEQIQCVCGGRVLELLTKKPILASDEEILKNRPSRSAKLRGARKIADIGVTA